MRLKPRFSLKADPSSGDNPRLIRWGHLIHSFHPRVQTQFPHDVAVSTDWVIQWRESLLDGVYSVPGVLIRAADGSRVRFAGHRPGMEVRWQATHHLWFQAHDGIFYAGAFLQPMPGGNLNYWALWAGYKF